MFELYREENREQELHVEGNKLLNKKGVPVYEGPQRETSDKWVPRLLNWVEKNEYHITAWDFHDTAGPSLIKDLDTFEPTPFWGVYFKDFLKKRNG